MLTTILFFIISGLAVACALGVVMVRSAVHGALLLGACLSMVGGLYALMGADFLFAAQILIYVGAIAILFLFVVLLAGRKQELMERPFNGIVLPAASSAIVAGLLIAGIIMQVRGLPDMASGEGSVGMTTANIGALLLGPHALGMEILGIILLVSLVGVSLLARGLDEAHSSQAPVALIPTPKANGNLSHGSAIVKEVQKV